MNNPQYSFKTDSYFPDTFIVFGYIILAASIASLVSGHLISLLFVIPGIVLITSHYRIEFDSEKNTCQEFIWILGFRGGVNLQDGQVEYIFIKKNRYSAKLQSRVSSTTISNYYYDGYLKFENGKKFFLCTNRNKEKTVGMLKKINLCINTRIVDLTGEGTVEVA